MSIQADEIHLGDFYSAPVFFDDEPGDRNLMFLAEGVSVKKYHIDAIKKWGMKKFFTFGKKVDINELDMGELEEI